MMTDFRPIHSITQGLRTTILLQLLFPALPFLQSPFPLFQNFHGPRLTRELFRIIFSPTVHRDTGQICGIEGVRGDRGNQSNTLIGVRCLG